MKFIFIIKNLNCAHCASKISDVISKLDYIEESNLNFLSKKLTVITKNEISEKELLEKINNIASNIEAGVLVIPFEDENNIEENTHTNECHDENCSCGHSHHEEHHHKDIHNHSHNHKHFHSDEYHHENCSCGDSHHEEHHKEQKYSNKKEISFKENINKIKSLSFSFENMLFIVGIIMILNSFLIPKGLGKTIYLFLTYIIVGGDILYKSLLHIKNKNFLDENFLMSIATIGALCLGEFSEAIGVMVFYKIGEYFQDKAVNNSKKSIENLLKLKVVSANLKNEDGSITTISPNKIKLNDILVVKVGENIPVDGVIVKGNSDLNLSALTGESLPVSVGVGDEVLSGSININGVIEIKATKEYKNSTINKIIQMIEESSDKKAHSEKFITKFAKYYTPIVVVSALIVAFIVPLILGNFKLWLGRSLIFLVISCPCALVLSVPLTFFSSIGYASKKGILIKGGNFLERLKNIDTVVFDKTGTLTENNFKIEKIHVLESDENHILELAKAGEIFSNHPLGKVILNYGDIKILESHIKDYKEIAGKGISCTYKTSSLLIGNKKLMIENNISLENLSINNNVSSIVYVVENGILLGYITFENIIKENSKLTISELSEMKMKSFMLTGDNKDTANKIGLSLGLTEKNIFSELLPKDKVTTFEKIKENSKGAIFVGDGINDAPVLSISDVGIAMGGLGSDIAIESADIVLLQDDPYKVVEVLKLAKLNKKVVSQNIIFSLGIKILVMILGIFGLANMWMAIFADVGVSLIAVLNASKILKTKKL
ncbi:heavy metal translocating P-type ATPase [Fusobacterium perfoetens]|uniref:heavy metal translocating P-type ATPase n=1 Tax=Fusobacterium perfoetens TaxID=852 RepID=UPI000486501D|nr:heavy metal translocating P-type ATPase [Fusobacterium perfoetens]